jgi:hypothetical protein
MAHSAALPLATSEEDDYENFDHFGRRVNKDNQLINRDGTLKYPPKSTSSNVGRVVAHDKNGNLITEPAGGRSRRRKNRSRRSFKGRSRRYRRKSSFTRASSF